MVTIEKFALNYLVSSCLLIQQCVSTEPVTAVNTKLRYDRRESSSVWWFRRNYTSLVFDCRAFADKSLLIKEIISDPNKLIIIISPRSWGKSINLHMLKTFFKIQVTPTGIRKLPINSTFTHRLFAEGEIIYENGTRGYLDTPLLITKHEDIIDQYQGKSPVIYITLKRIGHDMDYRAAIEMYKVCASDAFEQHKYLTFAFRRIIQSPNFDVEAKTEAARRLNNFYDILLFRKKMTYLWQNRELDFENLLNSLYFLSETLHKYFQKKVILLIDDYDTPWVHLSSNRLMSAEDKEKTYQFYTTFMTKTFVNNDHLEKTILSGIFPPIWEHKNTIFRHSVEYSYLNGHLMEFYGYNQWEMKTWFSFFNISEKMQNDVNVYYGGYKANKKHLQIYNPYSTGALWYDNKFEKYWTRSWSWRELFEKILRIVSFREKFYSLVNDNEILVNFPGIYFTWDQLNLIHDVIMISFNDYLYETYHFDPKEYDDEFNNNVLMYLQIHGYLTLGADVQSPGQYYLKFPNVEVRETMKKELIIFYEFDLDLDMKRELGTILRKKFKRYLKNNETFCITFERFFLDYMHMSPNFFKTVQKDLDQDHDILHFMLNYLLIGVARVHKEIKEFYTSGRSAVLIEFEDRIVIVKFAFDKPSARHIAREIKSYRSINREVKNSSKIIKYIGVNVYRNKTIQLWADLQRFSKPLLKKSTTEHFKRFETTRRQSVIYGKTTTRTTYTPIDPWAILDRQTFMTKASKGVDRFADWPLFRTFTTRYDSNEAASESINQFADWPLFQTSGTKYHSDES